MIQFLSLILCTQRTNDPLVEAENSVFLLYLQADSDERLNIADRRVVLGV